MTHIDLFKTLGWEREKEEKKESELPHIHRSIPIPKNLSFFKKLMLFAGPGFLVAVGYMDPGNWATDLAGGSKFGFTLLSVILFSNFLAMLLQHLALKLGIVTGKDLAQMCKEKYSKKTAIFLWLMAEVMIIACDLAEVLGSALALNLLFGIPILFGVLITVFDVFLLLLLQDKGFRYIEAVVVTLITTITAAFFVELFLSSPSWGAVFAGFIPNTKIIFNPEMLYIAVGILGATVMPHNLYLHSAIVQTRAYEESEEGKKEAVKFATIDSTFALFIALFVNAAILIVSAATFYYKGHVSVVEISDAYKLLAPILGTGLASVLFAVSLLLSGQNSTVTGTLAGQIIMEGFINLKIKPWLRRFITRFLAIIPAVLVISLYGEQEITKLLIWSQIILSVQLSFAVFPLIIFTNDKKVMGNFANSKFINVLSWFTAILIALLNLWLVINIFK